MRIILNKAVLSKLGFGFLLSLGLTLVAQTLGQELELTSYLNARSSALFRQSDNNIKAVLPKGTLGRIEEIKNFFSGNSGYLITVKNGPQAGEKLWVYHNKKNPHLKLLTQNNEETVITQKAEQVKITKPLSAVSDPASRPSKKQSTDTTSAAELTQTVASATQKLQKIQTRQTPENSSCSDCEAQAGRSATPPTQVVVAPKLVPAPVALETQKPIKTEVNKGLISTEADCQSPSDEGQTWAAKTKLKIVNNKVVEMSASAQNCHLQLKDFQQIIFPNTTNIVLKNNAGCTITVFETGSVRGSRQPNLLFSVSQCQSQCPGIDKKFWQVELNPHLNKCI